ncbi:MAG: hypothetical protein D6797_00225 [Bdellovibrio sp.]|nr:MAG: hypothetical protein D6797_00225 [Bdellovibrio sp.]
MKKRILFSLFILGILGCDRTKVPTNVGKNYVPVYSRSIEYYEYLPEDLVHYDGPTDLIFHVNQKNSFSFSVSTKLQGVSSLKVFLQEAPSWVTLDFQKGQWVLVGTAPAGSLNKRFSIQMGLRSESGDVGLDDILTNYPIFLNVIVRN